MYELLYLQLIRKKLVRTSKRTTLYDSRWTNNLNYKHVWVDINQVNITYENRSKHIISFYLAKLGERILIKLNLYLILKEELWHNNVARR